MRKTVWQTETILSGVLLTTGLLLAGGCALSGGGRGDAGKPAAGVRPAAEATSTPEEKHQTGLPDWKSDRYSGAQDAAPVSPPVQGCPTEAGAIRLAMQQIILKYGRETLNRQLPLEAEIDEKGIWQVRGTLPPQTSGRVNEVRIDSRTGKIIKVR